MRPARKLTVQTVFVAFFLCFVVNIACPVFVIALGMQTNPTGTAAQVQSTQVPSPELLPTPRSQLEIIQYILLPFAIGASLWLIQRLEKMERVETNGNAGQ